MKRALVVLFAVAAAAGCRSARSDDIIAAVPEEEERDPPRDLCLGDRAEPLEAEQLAAVRSTWEALARGDQPAPLALRNYSAGRCRSSWWYPVDPMGGCSESPPAFAAFGMRDVGTVVVDGRTGKWTFTNDGGAEVWSVDGYVVARRGAAVTVETASGTRALPAFPERIINDDYALVLQPSAAVVDTRTGKRVLGVHPRGPGPHNVAGSVVVRDPTRSFGVAVVGALDFGPTSWEAFALDGNGQQIASVKGPLSNVALPVATRNGAVVLVAWRPPTLDIAHVNADGTVRTRSDTLSGIFVDAARAGRDTVIAAGAGDTVAVGIGSQLVVVDVARPEQAPFVIEGGDMRESSRTLAPLTVLDGGVVVVARSHGGPGAGSLVVDARTGRTIITASDPEGPRIMTGGIGVIVVDGAAADENYAVVVDAAGDVARGKIEQVQVGRFTLQTFAGVLDPARECSAHLLSLLPPLVRYSGGDGDVFLPDALVR